MKSEELIGLYKAGERDFNSINLRGTDLSDADLSGADLSGTDLTGADLPIANLTRANLTEANLTRANLIGANLTEANLTGANLTGANLTRANLTRANLIETNLTGANLIGANLIGANLTGANLTGANLTEFDCSGFSQLINLIETNLTDANLTEANLIETNLTRANLTGANLTGANLTGANLTRANLTGANLTGANLTGTNLTGARLINTKLSNINLIEAVITGYIEKPFSKNQVQRIIIKQRNIYVEKNILRRYYLSFKSSQIVILSGISGTGKTSLTKAYADAVGAEYLLVSVAPNWASNEDLLGYFNPIDSEYHYTAFSRFIEQAAQDYQQAKAIGYNPTPHHLVLDEMNLARVEYYFAEFLSKMELRMREGVATLDVAPNKQILLPPNLYFIGTVNMDETTHGFADKVYDRAQIIELTINATDIENYLQKQLYDEEYSNYGEIILSIWKVLEDVAPFAYRVINEIITYIREAEKLGNQGKYNYEPWREALDEQVLQKILPKVKGTDERVGEALTSLIEMADKENLELSSAKAKKMLKMFEQHGLTSYF